MTKGGYNIAMKLCGNGGEHYYQSCLYDFWLYDWLHSLWSFNPFYKTEQFLISLHLCTSLFLNKCWLSWIASRCFRLIPQSEDYFEHLLCLPSTFVIHSTNLIKRFSTTPSCLIKCWTELKLPSDHSDILSFLFTCEQSIKVKIPSESCSSNMYKVAPSYLEKISWNIIFLDIISRWYGT